MKPIQPGPTVQANYLTPFGSVFLDAVRLMAALNVAFTHAWVIWFRQSVKDLIPSNLSGLSHGSVIVFFVLSGYVIAYTTQAKKRSAPDYAVARLSRLYSMLLPALLFTVLVSLMLQYANPQLLSIYTRGNTTLRCITSLFFSNEIWFFSSAPLINNPLWSLGYEFWFYAIFGCCMYRHNKKGLLFVAIACTIAGPKILIMMGIWLMGVWAYRCPKPVIAIGLRFCIIMLLMATSVLTMLYMPQLPYKLGASKLYWASSFISDYISALFIALGFAIFPLTVTAPPAINKNTVRFRKVADMTFPLYVFHYPCLVLLRHFIEKDQYTGMFTALGITVAFCFIIGLNAEKMQWLFARFFRTSICIFIPSYQVINK